MRTFKPKYRDKRTGKLKPVSKWWIELRDHLQIVRRFPAFTDKGQSQKFGEKIEKLVVCRENREPPDRELSNWLASLPEKLKTRLVDIGLADAVRVAAGKPLAEHIADFRQSLMDKGDTYKHAQMTVSRAQRIVDDCEFAHWPDIVASKVQRCVAELQDGGLSKRTANCYLKAFQHFARWMVQDGRATASPVAHLRGLEVQKRDIRRQRRPLEADEVRRLLEATRAGGSHFGLSGGERAMIYRLAVESGLRAKELRSLRVSCFDFDSCTLTVQDHTTKNRREKTLSLRPDTVAEVRQLLGRKLPDAQAFKVPRKSAKMLKRDLKAAGIPYQDDAGRYADFHSLRHTTGSLLAASGVHPKVVQEIMRHGDINLTMNLYTHTLRGQEADAVKRLPDFSGPAKQTQRKTGTDDLNVTAGDLASGLPFQGGKHRTTMDSRGQTTPVYDSTNRVFEPCRRVSNPQASDNKNDSPRSGS